MNDKKLFLLDMDGTLYLGDRLFPETIPFLDEIRARGGRYLYLTNNSSRSAESYVEKLRHLGIRANAHEFLTSTNATILYLKEHYPEKTVYVFGTRSFYRELAEAGIKVTTKPTDDVTVLCMGFDTELTFEKLNDASFLLTRGVDYVATNPDLVCPTEYGYVPDCGSVAGMLKNATGRLPRFIGKPEPEMVILALQATGIAPEDAVLIGDRLYTDIAAGNRAGIDTVFVLSGEGTLQDVAKSENKPTAIMKNIGDFFHSGKKTPKKGP